MGTSPFLWFNNLSAECITSWKSLSRLFTKEITHCFGVPNKIITNLGSSFTGSGFWDFCQDNRIDVYYSSVAHLGATIRSSVAMPWCYKP
jgi:hypothetical protein